MQTGQQIAAVKAARALKVLASLRAKGAARPIVFKDAGVSTLKAPAIDLVNRTARFAIWDAARDREGDVLPPELLRIDDYERNPVVMFHHNWRPGSPDPKPLPIGKCVGLDLVDGVWFATLKFFEAREAKPGLWVNQLAEEVWQAVANDEIRTVSIGFDPLAGEKLMPDGQGIFYAGGASLLEISVTPIPAKPSAALDKRLKRISDMVIKTQGTTGTDGGGKKPEGGGTTSDGAPAVDHEATLAAMSAHVAAMGSLCDKAASLHSAMQATHEATQQTHAQTMAAHGEIAKMLKALADGNAGDGGDAVEGDTSDVGEGDDGKDPEKAAAKAKRDAVLKFAESIGVKGLGFKGSGAGSHRMSPAQLGHVKAAHKALTASIGKHMASGGTVDPDPEEGDDSAAKPGEQQAADPAGKTQPPGDPGGDDAFPKALAKALGEAKTIDDFGGLILKFPKHRSAIEGRARDVAKTLAEAQAKIMRAEYERNVLGRTNTTDQK